MDMETITTDPKVQDEYQLRRRLFTTKKSIISVVLLSDAWEEVNDALKIIFIIPSLTLVFLAEMSRRPLMSSKSRDIELPWILDNELKFVEELLKLKAADVQTRLITIRKLQRDALNFSRQSMFQILEQFLAATEST